MRLATISISRQARSIALLVVVLCLFGVIPTTTISAQASGWHLIATVVPKGWTPQRNDTFGWSLAMDGDTLVAGAIGRNHYAGAAEVFVRSGKTWAWQAELVAKDAKPGDSFGWAVAIQGDTILVGAPHKDKDTGQVYLFQRTGKTWAQQDFPRPDGIMPGDLYGWIIVSAPLPTAGPATPAATDQANLIPVSFTRGDVPPHSRPSQEELRGSIFCIGAPGTHDLSGDEGCLEIDYIDGARHQSVTGTFHQSGTLGSFRYAGKLTQREKTVNIFFLGEGYTVKSPPEVANSYASSTLDSSGKPTAPITSHDIPLDPGTDHFGAMLPIPAAQSWNLLEAPMNASSVVTALNLYNLTDDGTVTPLDKEPAAVGGMVYGYVGASNGTDIALLGVDANQAGSIGFYTIQNNKLVAGPTLPFSIEAWQLYNTDGVSSFAFSTDGTTLVAATMDPKTQAGGIAILEKS
jgi:hypothetical protein